MVSEVHFVTPCFVFFYSLVNFGSVERCLTELKTPNVLPGEREDIKSQVNNSVTDSF